MKRLKQLNAWAGAHPRIGLVTNLIIGLAVWGWAVYLFAVRHTLAGCQIAAAALLFTITAGIVGPWVKEARPGPLGPDRAIWAEAVKYQWRRSRSSRR
jgi:hypothetical protein